MSSKMPPVPPAERSDKGPGGSPAAPRDTTPRGKDVPQNAAEQGDTANIRQNTSNQNRAEDRG